MDISLSEAEVACLKALAAMFEGGKTSCHGNPELLGLTQKNWVPVLRMLEQHGFIGEPMHTAGGYYSYFTINASAVQAVRAMEKEERQKQERKDIVEYVKVTLRKHPVMGWLCVVAVGLTAVITAINQFLSLLKNLGAMQ